MGSKLETFAKNTGFILVSFLVLEKKSKAKSLSKMSYLAPSMTAMKYRREPFLGRPLEPGERYSVCREMESCIRGFKEVSRDLTEARRVLDHQKRMSRSASIERVPAASFYKSVVGTRSAKGGGSIYFSEMVGRVGTFRNPTSNFSRNL